jgi:Uma2 family endonuclease
MFRPVEIGYKGFMAGRCEGLEDSGRYVRRIGSRRESAAMVSPARVEKRIRLEEFLHMPEIDEQPYLEYIDGRIEAKPAFGMRASVLMGRLVRSLDQFVGSREFGESFISLRCTFEGRSLVCAIAFLLGSHIPVDERGEYADETPIPPDIHVEFLSPDECSDERPRDRLAFATSHGAALGWLIDPDRMRVLVYRPGRHPEELSADGVLEGDPVLPGYHLPVAELFGWLIWRKPDRKPAPPRSQPPTLGEPSL